MNSFKKLTLAVPASLMLIFAPAVNAQQMDDIRMMQEFLKIVDAYFEVIESTYSVSSSAEKSAILQMQKIKEVYEERGEKARSVEILRSVLDESRNPTIRNAAYMLLSDNLKETGRTDEALEVLRAGLEENISAAN